MKIVAGVVAAREHGAAEFVDPRPYLVGTLKETFEHYPEIGTLLPAMGYHEEQLQDLQETINAAPCDLVLFATPIQLTRILAINKPAIRVRYEYQDHGEPTLGDVLRERLNRELPASE